jgi:isopenicillin N synthase-like dioxygenase
MPTSRVSKQTPHRVVRPRIRRPSHASSHGNTANSYQNVLSKKVRRAMTAHAMYMFLLQANARPNLLNAAANEYRKALLEYARVAR